MKKNNLDSKQLQILIAYLKKKEKNIHKMVKSRKATKTDFFCNMNQLSINKSNVSKKEDKVLKFRMQEEFGQKKRIKP